MKQEISLPHEDDSPVNEKVLWPWLQGRFSYRVVNSLEMARKKKNVVVSPNLKKKLLLALPDESDSFCGYARKCLRDSLQTADVRDECVLRREVRELIQMVRQQHFYRPRTRLEAESALVRLLLFALSKSLGLMHRTGSSIPGKIFFER